MGEEVTRKALEDVRTAPISEKLRRTLLFLEKMSLQPNALTPDDARHVMESGVSREALQDAVYVSFLFNTLDRLADTLGWDVPDMSFFRRGARFLLERGYG